MFLSEYHCVRTLCTYFPLHVHISKTDRRIGIGVRPSRLWSLHLINLRYYIAHDHPWSGHMGSPESMKESSDISIGQVSMLLFALFW